MIDKHGRIINYLRLSVTARCNKDCAWCRRSDGADEMTVGEIERIASLFSMCGIQKIRLTGGEPLIREDIRDIVKACRPYVNELALTTNGELLGEKAAELKAAGLDRVNIGGTTGIDAAIKAKLRPKINAVLTGDTDVDGLIKLAADKNIEIRFIEYMPMGRGEDLYVPATHIDTKNVGLITPVSAPFCGTCNRLRVTPDCKIRLCLGNNLETDLREILRHNDSAAINLIKKFAQQKPEKGFCDGFVTNRGMGNIGG